MKHKLEFVKISNKHLFAGVGFAGNIFIVLSVLSIIPDEDILVVDMETNECVCTQNDFDILKTKNCWEYYFDQELISDGEFFYKTNSLVSGKFDYTFDFSESEKYEYLKKKLYDSFKLKPYIIEKLKYFYDTNLSGKNTLGVQIRLTDMEKNHSVSSINSYIKKIDEILKVHPEIDQIFLATDDYKAISIVEKQIQKKVIYFEGMFRADEFNLHTDPYDRYNSSRPYHKYNLGLEVILEIFTLTKCDFLLKADISALSIVATILSEKIKKIYKV